MSILDQKLKKLSNTLIIDIINGTTFFKKRIFTKKNKCPSINEKKWS